MGRQGCSGGRPSAAPGENSTTTHGCMPAFRHLFDFHPLQHSMQRNPSSFRPDSAQPVDEGALLGSSSHDSGVAGRRDGLESMDPAPLSSIEEEGDAGGPWIRPTGMNIKTRSSAAAAVDSNSGSGGVGSPGIKTPGLVARLMGLDLLPDSPSPETPIGKTRREGRRSSLHNDGVRGCRSLPGTPRMSSARRSDVDHRLSLQINKENIEDFFVARREAMKHGDDRSPGGYARQIVRRVRESVSRRVAGDVTNTVRNRENRGDEPFQSQKSAKSPAEGNSEGTDQAVPPCPPRLGFSESRTKLKTVVVSSAKNRTPRVQHQGQPSTSFLGASLRNRPQPNKIPSHPKQKPSHQPRKAATEQFGRRLKTPPQALEALVRSKQEEPLRVPCSGRKCRRTPLTNELIVHPKTVVPVTKAAPPKLTRQLWTQEATHDLIDRRGREDSGMGGPAAVDGDAGDDGGAGVPRRSDPVREPRISQRSPQSPSVLCRIEISSAAAASPAIHPPNRKLISDLIDEVSRCILKQGNSWKPWAIDADVNGHQVSAALCTEIGRFPAVDCRVVEDIDGLIAWDLTHPTVQPWEADYEDEWEGVFREIERGVRDSLFLETAAAAAGVHLVGTVAES